MQQQAAEEAVEQYAASGKKTLCLPAGFANTHSGVKVQLQFWKKKPKPADNATLERLDNLIRTE